MGQRSRYGPSDDDVVLVAAAQRGERDAMDLLLGRHYERLAAVCRRVIGSDADAADATQETLILLVKGIARFDGTSSFRTWSYRVATNAALDELRRRGRRPLPNDTVERLIESNPTAGFDGPGHVEQMMDIGQALDRIPIEFRAPIVLRDVCGLDYAEIAEVLAIPPGTVRSRIARGRAALAPHFAAPFIATRTTAIEPVGNQNDASHRPRTDHVN